MSSLSLGFLYTSLESLRKWLLIYLTGGIACAGVSFVVSTYFYEKQRKAHLS